MRPRPKNLSQILAEKWPEQHKKNIKPEYTSEISKELALNLPNTLRKCIKVVQFERGILTVSLPNASYQMQYNACRSQLISQLRVKYPNLISIKCQVDPNMSTSSNLVKENSASYSTSANKAAKTLSDKAKQDLTATMQDLPENIQAALSRLINLK
ncbi:hypothetical protein DS2_05105 [Catenovulum agarivorans DS-2]|uniref:DUF721 domain-containing protein n=1 Tax=Catenovulum agarivorans DS-2 TaxID=1328313 RepID=W7QTN4_9ALTE|nr:DciA family protein [Catenovulum agarivorans]EWH11208.1 hypothetical protein DS2_05105 [Catenovulum agarivorans DS-2]